MNVHNDDNHAARPVPRRPGKVVVAGGSGFIGTHLIAGLRHAGHQVVVLSRRAHSAGAPVSWVRWDPGRGGDWESELEGADALVNLCGASLAGGRWTRARKQALVASRTLPSRTLVAACNRRETPPAVLLQASGVNYYGTGEDERDEQSEPGHDFLAHLAYDWERPLDDTTIRTVSLRFGAVLQRSSGALPQMLLPFRLFAGGPIAGGRQWLSWIHVQDAVRAIVFLMDSPLADAVNVCAPRPVRQREFAGAAGTVLRRPALLPLPAFALRAALGEQATLVCDGVHAVPAKLEAAGFEFRFPGIDQALVDLVGS